MHKRTEFVQRQSTLAPRERRARALAALAALAAVLAFGDGARAEGAPSSATAPHDYRDANFDYFVAGDPRAPRARSTHFLLALMGGGGRLDSAFEALAAAAGHGRIVVLRAVADDQFDPTDGDYGEAFRDRWGPVVSAETLVFHRRAAAYDPRVLAVLRGADGIFLAGGDQANYIRYWKGTPVADALNAHVRAKRPIGGSSAGLAILGHYSYTALDGGSLESKVAFADPLGPAVTLESDFLHLRWLEHVMTDTHFSQRCRLGRLITSLERIRAVWRERAVFGIGVDERTVLLVGADGTGRIAAGSAGSVWVVHPAPSPPPLMPGEPLSVSDVEVTRLGADGTLALRDGRVSGATGRARVSIARGRPVGESIASPILMRDTVPPDED